MTVIDVIAVTAPASADPALTVEVVKYPTPVFGVRLADLVKGMVPNDMDIVGPPENQRDMDGGQASHVYQIRPHNHSVTASAIYDVEQNGQRLGSFRVDLNLGGGGDPNTLQVTCNEQDSPVDCWAFENPYVVRIYAKSPANGG
ncbi:hypothetical protein [Mycobacterium sp.]|uniref:hypothetical protein n=1 Tax=Mycobacterium sp. TaxID=1785 RepID=UPI002CDEE07C|nr:hypothetical protein [Mycobacterium sp.]HTQ21124.1 hypothetical protein [Mycobacterium sp.]